MQKLPQWQWNDVAIECHIHYFFLRQESAPINCLQQATNVTLGVMLIFDAAKTRKNYISL